MSSQDAYSRLHLAGEQSRGASRLPAQTLREEINATFTPWEKDPERIARLLLWLELMNEAPRSVAQIAAFIRDPTPYSQQYEDMVMFEGKTFYEGQES